MKKQWTAPSLEVLPVSQTMKGWDKPHWPPYNPTKPDPNCPSPTFPDPS